MTTDGIQVVPGSGPPPEGAVRVRVTSSGICGSDLHLASLGPSWAILGHEFCGLLDDGSAVAVLPIVHCGTCDRCRAGAEQQCRQALGAMYGVSLDGGLADECWVDPRCTRPLAAGTSPQDGHLIEPLAVALHGIHLAGVTGEMPVLVLGAGPIGLCAVVAARRLGAEVTLEAHRPDRLEAGERLGASVAVTGDYEVILDAAGTQSSMDRALELVRPGGRIAVLGTYWEPVALGLAFQTKEAALLPSFTYGHHHGVDEFATAGAILAETPDLATTIVTHRFGLDDSAEAFRVAGDRSQAPIKVVVHP